jgi:phosphate transport system ATP-binding protein
VHTLKDVTLHIRANQCTALIGPSGCGKSTFVRCLNRMHETNPIARAEGVVRMGDVDIYQDASPVEIRRRVGMVFQRPNPFPSMSIYDNVASGLKLNGYRKKRVLDEVVERSLKQAALWEEVKDDLKKKSGASLSGGQQQRLCIARALAADPEVILLDEPCSSLDPRATSTIEELILELRSQLIVVVVTHNLAQAQRVSDLLAFILDGSLVETGETARVFAQPREEATAAYLGGAFG